MRDEVELALARRIDERVRAEVEQARRQLLVLGGALAFVGAIIVTLVAI